MFIRNHKWRKYKYIMLIDFFLCSDSVKKLLKYDEFTPVIDIHANRVNPNQIWIVITLHRYI